MFRNLIRPLPMFILPTLWLLPLQAQERTQIGTTPVQMTVSMRVVGDIQRTPVINSEDIIVRQGEKRLQVTGWTPVSREQSRLDLFILIDDAADLSLVSQFDELRGFINSLPANIFVGVAYMRNGTAQIFQNPTDNRYDAAKAIHPPFLESEGSPCLSVVDLMNQWPAGSTRREVLMITDGIDRTRGGPRTHGLSLMSPDVYVARTVAQHMGTIIDTIFARGVVILGDWEIRNGQATMAKLAHETGGESFYLDTKNLVSFHPYLDTLRSGLDNRYLLEFSAIPGGKSGLQDVEVTTNVGGVELDSADSVWVKAQ